MHTFNYPKTSHVRNDVLLSTERSLGTEDNCATAWRKTRILSFLCKLLTQLLTRKHNGKQTSLWKRLLRDALHFPPASKGDGGAHHPRHHHVLVRIVLLFPQLLLCFLQLLQHAVHLVIQVRDFGESPFGFCLGAGGILGTKEAMASENGSPLPTACSLPLLDLQNASKIQSSKDGAEIPLRVDLRYHLFF